MMMLIFVTTQVFTYKSERHATHDKGPGDEAVSVVQCVSKPGIMLRIHIARVTRCVEIIALPRRNVPAAPVCHRSNLGVAQK